MEENVAESNGRVRVGLIGCGRIVEIEHLPAMLGSERVELVGCADSTPGRAASIGALGGLDESRCHEDYRRLLARDDVELVSIAVPPSVRAQVVLDAAAAGKHVVCEKPFALSLAEADAMLAAFERSGTTLAMYHNYLYYFEHRLASSLIADGSIGEVVRVEICGPGSRPSLGADGFQPTWRWDPVVGGGGVTMDIGVHAFYLCELFLPEPVTSGERGNALRRLGRGRPRLLHAAHRRRAGRSRRRRLGPGVLPLRDRRHATASSPTSTTRAPATSGRRCGRCASARWKARPSCTRCRRARTQFTPQIYDDLAGALAGTGAAYPAYGRDGRRAVEIAHAAYHSADTGETVRLPLDSGFALYESGPTAMLLARQKEPAGAR